MITDRLAIEALERLNQLGWKLTKLIGSEKQIKWAEDIRIKAISRNRWLLTIPASGCYQFFENAKWWIDGRLNDCWEQNICGSGGLKRWEHESFWGWYPFVLHKFDNHLKVHGLSGLSDWETMKVCIDEVFAGDRQLKRHFKEENRPQIEGAIRQLIQWHSLDCTSPLSPLVRLAQKWAQGEPITEQDWRIANNP